MLILEIANGRCKTVHQYIVWVYIPFSFEPPYLPHYLFNQEYFIMINAIVISNNTGNKRQRASAVIDISPETGEGSSLQVSNGPNSLSHKI
jgi:hypothetical protein